MSAKNNPANPPTKLKVIKMIETKGGFVLAIFITTKGMIADANLPVPELNPKPKPLLDEMYD